LITLPLKRINGPNAMIGQTLYGSMPSSDYIDTFRGLNVVIAIGMWTLSTSIT